MTAVSEFAPAPGPQVDTQDSSWWAAPERILGLIVEISAAILVVAEVVVLFSGIVARYVLHKPLTWSDELASTLFLWLAMLGAVVALRRSEHMRMTAIVFGLNEPARKWFDTLAVATGLAFLALVAAPAYHWASEEAFITTPALEISAAWRAAAFPVGVSLMLVFSLFHLARASLLQAGSALALVAATIVAFWWLGPTLKSLGNLNLLIFFVGVVSVCVFSGVPIVFSFALATFGLSVVAFGSLVADYFIFPRASSGAGALTDGAGVSAATAMIIVGSAWQWQPAYYAAAAAMLAPALPSAIEFFRSRSNHVAPTGPLIAVPPRIGGIIAALGVVLTLVGSWLPYVHYGDAFGSPAYPSIFNGGSPRTQWFAAEPVAVAILAVVACVLLVVWTERIPRVAPAAALMALGIQTFAMFLGYASLAPFSGPNSQIGIGSVVGMIAGLCLLAGGALAVAEQPFRGATR